MEGSLATPASSLAALESWFHHHPSAIVAFSGGVDSGVVAAAAHRALGERALAVTIYGPAVAWEEVQRATQVAAALGIRHRLLRLDPTQDAAYASNPVDRCYFCRGLEGRLLRSVAEEEGFSAIVDGIHRDDLGDDRPGIRAMNELGVLHPLLDAGLGKSEVRRIARELQLPNQDTPSNSCLASRIAHGDPVTPALLARVEAAEVLLGKRGFRRVRVRTSHGAARIEVDPPEVPQLLEPGLRAEVERALRALGFSSVEVDPLGYRPGGRPREAPTELLRLEKGVKAPDP